MSRPSADTTWGGGSDAKPGCPWLMARVVLLVALVLGLMGGGAP